MADKTNQEYENAQSRISTLIAEIGDQLKAIATPTDSNEPNDVDSVIAEQEKSGFIFKQTELISAFINRDDNGPRDAYIAELEEKIAKAERNSKYENERWYKEYQANKNLKAALHSLTAILALD